MLNNIKARFITWLKMCMDDKTELVLLNYYKTEEHELRLYVCKVSTNEFLHKHHFILWDNDEAYYYSDPVTARQAFESMNKLYYHAENYSGR